MVSAPRADRHGGASWDELAIYCISALLNRPQEANGRGWEDTKTLLKAGIEVRHVIRDRTESDLVFRLELAAHLLLELLVRSWVTEEIVGESGERTSRCLAASDDEERSVDDDFVLRQVVVLRLLENIVDKISPFTLGVLEPPAKFESETMAQHLPGSTHFITFFRLYAKWSALRFLRSLGIQFMRNFCVDDPGVAKRRVACSIAPAFTASKIKCIQK